MTDDNNASPTRVNGILAGLRTREWPEGEAAFVSRENWAEFIATLAADRDRWKSEAEHLATEVYVPGLWKCAKCGFTLIQRTLRVIDGAVGVRDEAGEHCPNDNAPLWRVTERDASNDLACRATEYLERAVNAETDRDRWKAAAENMHERCQKVFDVCRSNAWKLAADICKLPLKTDP